MSRRIPKDSELNKNTPGMLQPGSVINNRSDNFTSIGQKDEVIMSKRISIDSVSNALRRAFARFEQERGVSRTSSRTKMSQMNTCEELSHCFGDCVEAIGFESVTDDAEQSFE